MALNVPTLPLILCRQVKTIRHGSVRFNIVHVPMPCFLNFCSAVPTTFFSTRSCPFITTCIHYNWLSLLPRIQHAVRSSLTFKACRCMMISICDARLVIIDYYHNESSQVVANYCCGSEVYHRLKKHGSKHFILAINLYNFCIQ